MKILSVNIGKRRAMPGNKSGYTGIFKEPVVGPVNVGELGLEGDAIVDKRHHGGEDQAVYLYGQPDYDFWANELGQDMEPGLFGENLTVAGLESGKINVGDRFICGSLVLEVTSPRIPCGTFAARMNDKLFPDTFMKSERPGVYCRVLSIGELKVGKDLAFVPFEGEHFSLAEYMRNWRGKKQSEAELRRYLKTPVHLKSRAEWEARLT